jgi:hypothetical protein
MKGSLVVSWLPRWQEKRLPILPQGETGLPRVPMALLRILHKTRVLNS